MKKHFIHIVLVLVTLGLVSMHGPSIAESPVISKLAVVPIQKANDLQPYTVKQDIVEMGLSERLLIIASVPPDTPEHKEYYDYSLNSLSTLSDILGSHWPIQSTIVTLDAYQSSMLREYDAVMVIDVFNEQLSPRLYDDLITSELPITWIGFNTEYFLARILDEPVTVLPIPTLAYLEYEDVQFKSQGLHLHVGLPTDHERVEAIGNAVTITEESYPLAVHVDQRITLMPFDVPYEYSLDHYSLPFLDMMHLTLGHHEPVKRALLRLEDVNAVTYRNVGKLRHVYHFLKERNVPFHIALIVRYINPAEGVDMLFGEKERFLTLMQRMVGEGLGTIIQHGYTHQYQNSISGEGFEFWDEIKDKPIAEDSEGFVRERVEGAQAVMHQYGFPIPDIWETPHYAQSKLANDALNDHYPLRYEHILNIGYLPFVANINNTIYLPENLGFVVDPEKDMAEIEHRLELLSVFDNPVASVFWHPWRDHVELRQIVNLIEDQGYEFVSAYDLLNSKPQPTMLAHGTSEDKGFAGLISHRDTFQKPPTVPFKDMLIFLMYASFILGTFLYARNIYRIRKYFKHLHHKTISISRLKKLAKAKKKKLPRIGIMVPARNEGLVIGNNIRRLANLDYPKQLYEVFIIPDERELDDDVEKTTQDVTREVGSELNKKHGRTFIHQIEVPKWYSGEYGSAAKTFERSTKGRALNYALQVIAEHPDWKDIEFIGVVDADGRLHTDVLKEVAYKAIKHNYKLLQGPVFQVSNFKNVNLIGVIGGLELAIHHLTELPHRILHKKKMQFLAGTNYFVHSEIMQQIGGWDQHALVEDAELAIRAYTYNKTIAGWLSQPEIEQTPANFSVYRRQRERWVRGHLMLIKDLIHSGLTKYDKARFLLKIFSAQMRFMWDISLPVLAFSLLLSGILADLNWFVGVMSWYLMLVSIFIWDSYGYMYRKLYQYIDENMTLRHKILQSIKLIIFIPIVIVAQAIPRVHALINYMFNLSSGWYKTERTQEAVTE